MPKFKLDKGEKIIAERPTEDGGRVVVTSEGRKVAFDREGRGVRLIGPPYNWEAAESEAEPAAEPEAIEPVGAGESGN